MGATHEGVASGDAASQPLDGVGRAADVSCPQCAASFTCGFNASSCWCQTLPALDLARLAPELVDRGCLCGDCLGVAIAEQMAV